MLTVSLGAPLAWREGGAVLLLTLLMVLLRPLWLRMHGAASARSPAAAAEVIARLDAAEAQRDEVQRVFALSEHMAHIGHWQVRLPDYDLTWSDGVYAIYGVSRESFQLTLESAIAPYLPADQIAIGRDVAAAVANRSGFEHAARLRRPNGEIRHILSRGMVLVDAAGTPVSLFGVVVDQTEERRREAAREASEARYRLLADHVSDLVICHEADLRLTYVSPSSLALLGRRAEELLGQFLPACAHPDDRAQVQRVLTAVAGGIAHPPIEIRLLRADGSAPWVEFHARPMPQNAGTIASARDISQRREAEERLRAANARLEELARVDALTGLANRRRFDEALAAECRRCARNQMPLSLILIDVDHFKMFNDRYGHPAGDATLRAVAHAVDGLARRPGDVAARYGGEELAVILPDTENMAAASIAERIRAAIRALGIDHADSAAGIVTASLGVATLYPRHGAEESPELIKQADARLYEAKSRGRDVVGADSP